MAKQQHTTLAAGATIIFVGTLVSRLLGLVRENLLNNTFHDRLIKDAFRSAILVPDMLYYLLAGEALSAAFIPVFAGYMSRGEQEDANRIANTITNLMLIAVLLGIVVILIFAPELVRVVAPGYVPGGVKFNLTVSLTREVCVMVVFTALSGLMTGMLQSMNHFLAPVIVWNTYSLCIILGISCFSKLSLPHNVASLLHWEGATLGIHGAALGVVLGAITLTVIQLPVIKKFGFRYAPVLDLRHEGVRRVLMLFAPAMAGLALSQINLMAVPQIIGSLLPTGVVNDIVNSTRLVLLPLGLFGTAVSSAAFPKLSQHASLGQKTEFSRMANQAVRVVLLLVMPCAVIMMVLAEPVVAFIYAGKEVSITDIQATGFLLCFFAWGILAVSMVQLISRVFYALQDTRTPVTIQVGMVLVNLSLAYLLLRYTPLTYGGVALAFSLSMTASTLIMMEILRRRLGRFGGRTLFTALWKTIIASAVMGAVMYLVGLRLAPMVISGTHTALLGPTFPFHWPPPDLSHTIEQGAHALHGHLRLLVMIQLLAALLSGTLVYAVTLWLLKAEELPAMLQRLTARFHR